MKKLPRLLACAAVVSLMSTHANAANSITKCEQKAIDKTLAQLQITPAQSYVFDLQMLRSVILISLNSGKYVTRDNPGGEVDATVNALNISGDDCEIDDYIEVAIYSNNG